MFSSFMGLHLISPSGIAANDSVNKTRNEPGNKTGLDVGPQDIRFLTHNVSDAAFIGEDGLMHGRPHAGRRAFYVETVMAMMAEAGFVSPIQQVSLNRGFFFLKSENNYAFFNLIKNDERRDLFKWVGPIAVFPTYYYELKSRPSGIQTIADAKNVNAICTLKGNNIVRLLKSMGHKNLLEAPSNDTCARLLEHGRVSLVTGSEYPWFISNPNLVKIFVRTPVIISIDEGFIAFSKTVADPVIKTWQSALDRIKKNGTYDAVRERFLVPKKIPVNDHGKSRRRLPTRKNGN